jgi:predicted nuclease of predicted toxin-antitoxin system
MAVISFYFDEMLSRKAAEQLVQRGYVVIMANDVGMTEKPDSEHLVYATDKRLVLVTFDRPFAGRAMQSTEHAGLVCLSGSQDNIGAIIRTLIDFADSHTPDEVIGRVYWL